MKTLSRILCFILSLALVQVVGAGDYQLRQIGVAKTDITPRYPIRLSGYAVRKTESQGVTQKLWAKALAIGSDKEGPAVLITVENTGVPAAIRDEVARRLQQKKKINPDRIALCSTHTHTAPWLVGYLPNLFGGPIPPAEQAHVERYTRELTDAIERVALAALKNRRAAQLSWGQTKAGFAANRRTKDGPVDHDLPVLTVTDAKGKLRAILANYACHCTTLGGDTNLVCGDWAGYAQEYLERDHPGAVALVSIGCGADANPWPRPGLDYAKQHGQEIANSVNQLLATSFGVPPSGGQRAKITPGPPEGGTPNAGNPQCRPLNPLHGELTCRTKRIELPFDTPPTRAEFEARAKGTNYMRYHAQLNLARLDRGEPLPTQLPYLVQTWTFGQDLAMVFLAGEVVVDYSLRLKKEFDATRLWLNAYANDVPCYIPSERVLQEGGYESDTSMIYYDKPTRFAPAVENLIVGAVHELLPKEFLAP